MCFRLLAILLLGALAGAQTPSTPDIHDRDNQKSKAAAEKERPDGDPLLDLPPLPDARLTLIGGTLAKLDRVRDRMVVRPFGGHDMSIAFDQRTKIFRDGVPIDARDLRPGSRVYVDTLFDGSRVFAKNIRVKAKDSQGDAQGQVVTYDSTRGVLEVREDVSPTVLRLRVTPQTSVRREDRASALSDLRVGSLVAVDFAASPGNTTVAREIRILASPGQVFTFAGTITFVDLRLKRIAIANRSDEISYEIAVDSIPSGSIRGVEEGAQATIETVFDGQHYQAKSIEVTVPSTRSHLDSTN